ncbi:hypothetical protein [Acinetobacter sp. 161(2023)]|uniref:hypothetical protein n=1 Tax=Acinetobacter sp. 161(2023) TaxID=3098768 RepID=UPI00300AB03A
MPSTSQVLIVDEVLSNNELKPEKPYGDQALNVLSCVVIAFGKGCQEIMDVQSQLLIIWSSARA